MLDFACLWSQNIVRSSQPRSIYLFQYGVVRMTPIYYVIYRWSEFYPSQIKFLTYPRFEINNDSLPRFIVVKDEYILHFFIHRLFSIENKSLSACDEISHSIMHDSDKNLYCKAHRLKSDSFEE